jgi:hypothetical protein
MPDDGPDVVDSGGEEARPVLTPLRVVAAVVAVVVVAVVAPRTGLLSAPGDGGRDPGAVLDDVGSLVARTDQRLVRLGPGGWEPSTELPPGLADAPLLPVFSASGRTDLLAAADGVLLRGDPERDEGWQELGRADQVVGAARPAGRVHIVRGDRVVEVDTATGGITDPAPFPGYAPALGWRAVTVQPATGVPALLMSRPRAPGRELAFAWPAVRVLPGADPPLTELGVFERPLGADADRLLSLGPFGCEGAACRVVVTTITRDEVLSREVEPPPGWRFAPGPTTSGVVQVRDGQRRALARLVPGGRTALLLAGSEGVDPEVGMVALLDGSIRFVTGQGGRRELRGWTPGDPRARRLAGAPPPGARLVCACS